MSIFQDFEIFQDLKMSMFKDFGIFQDFKISRWKYYFKNFKINSRFQVWNKKTSWIINYNLNLHAFEFSMKICEKLWNFRISQGFLGNLGSMKSTPQSYVQAYSEANRSPLRTICLPSHVQAYRKSIASARWNQLQQRLEESRAKKNVCQPSGPCPEVSCWSERRPRGASSNS